MNAWAKWAAPLLIVLLGALVGFELGRRVAVDAAAAAQSDRRRSERERIALEGANRRLLADNSSLERVLAEPEPVAEVVPESGPGLETIGRLKQLQQMKARVTVTAVQGGKLYPGFAQLYGLTDAEVGTLNDAIRQAHAEVKEPVVTAANVSMVNGALQVDVPPSGDGKKLRQKLLDEFAATLGPERFDALTAMSGLESIDRDFDAFGAAARMIAITRIPIGQPGGSGFRISDGRRTGTGSMTSITQFATPNQLPEKYRWLGPVLPSLADLRPPTGTYRMAPLPEKK